MKIIFLDIDGVLNYAGAAERSYVGFLGIVPSKVKLLKRIVDATDAQIVLVSTWKEEWDPNATEENQNRDAIYMLKQLSDQGLSLLDKTTDHISNRGHGIVSWLSAHTDVESFVILDDDTFSDYEPLLLLPHHVKTSFAFGLKPEHVSKAISILMGNV